MTAPGEHHDVLIDAAVTLMATYGIRRVTLQDVAAEAGVSRQTVYRYFGDRDGLVVAVISRERDRFVDEALAAAPADADLVDATRAVVAKVLQMAESNELFSRLRTSDPDLLAPALTSADNLVTDVIEPVVATFLSRHVPELSTSAAQTYSDLITRLLVSYVARPADRPIAELADAVAVSLSAGISSATPVRK